MDEAEFRRVFAPGPKVVDTDFRLYTIYADPDDAPVGFRYAVREWTIGPGQAGAQAGWVQYAVDLAGARAVVPAAAAVCLARVDGDDESVVESWA